MKNDQGNETSLEELYGRFRQRTDLDALGALFDRAAPRLLGLARRLAGRRTEAEDWVQQTFLTAIEKPKSFPEGAEVMPWLLGILVNHARSDRRQAARTPEADRLLERQVESPDARLNAAELRSVIEAAVSDLPPAQRQAVAGRLLDGRSSAELGRDLGLEPGAVRARLHRGLERLRNVLPAGLATGLFAWLSPGRGLGAVRTRVLEQAALQASTAAGAAATGAAVFTGKKLAAGLAGTAIAALLGFALFPLLSPAAKTPVEALAPAQQLVPSERAPAVVAAIAEAPASRTHAEAAPDSSIAVVTVLATDGDPVSGETVVLRAGRSSAGISLEAHTDEAGEARFELDPGTYVVSVQVPVGPTRPLVRETHYRPIPPGETQRFTLQLVPGFSILGHVVDEEGRRLAGAEVLAYCTEYERNEPSRRVLSGDDGSFRLDHLGPTVRVLARYEGMACLRGLRGAPEEVEEASGLELRMAPALETRGQVLHPDGRPAEGAKVWVPDGMSGRSSRNATHVHGLLTYRASSAEDLTDASGTFQLAGLTRGSIHPHVRLKPYLEETHKCAAGDQAVRITLDAGHSISGQVFLPSGAPAAGATVKWGPHYSNRHHAPGAATTDAVGRYSFDGLSRAGSPPWVGVSHAGHALAHLQPITIGAAQPDIHLAPETRIGGIVVDGSGKPLPNLRVWCLGTPELSDTHIDGRTFSLGYAFGLDQVRTDSKGAFLFERLPPGTYEVQVYPKDRAREKVSIQATGNTEDLRIEVSPKALARVVVKGRVTDAMTGEPVPKFEVTTFNDGRGFGTEIESDQGRFRIQGIDPGEIHLAITAPDYARSLSSAQEVGHGEHEYQFQLHPRRQLTVTAVHPDGSPFQGAYLRFADDTIRWRSMLGWSGGRPQIPREGLTLEALPGRPLNLLVWGRDAHREVSIDLSADQDHRIEVVLETPPRFSLAFWILEANAGTEAPGWRTEFEAAIAGEDRGWIQAAAKAGTLAAPQEALSLDLTPALPHRKSKLEAKVEPVESGVAIETKLLSDSGFSTSEVELPLCVIQESLPAGEYILRVESDTFHPIEESIVLDQHWEIPRVLLLHRR